jgi:hypothetical protein
MLIRAACCTVRVRHCGVGRMWDLRGRNGLAVGVQDGGGTRPLRTRPQSTHTAGSEVIRGFSTCGGLLIGGASTMIKAPRCDHPAARQPGQPLTGPVRALCSSAPGRRVGERGIHHTWSLSRRPQQLWWAGEPPSFRFGVEPTGLHRALLDSARWVQFYRTGSLISTEHLPPCTAAMWG